MSGGTEPTLRQKAALAWERERPMREAARLERRVKLLSLVRENLTRIFGPEYEIRVGVEQDGSVIAVVEDLRFTAVNYWLNSVTLLMVERCPRCGRDMPLGKVSDLADVGERLSEFASGSLHECEQTNQSS